MRSRHSACLVPCAAALTDHGEKRDDRVPSDRMIFVITLFLFTTENLDIPSAAKSEIRYAILFFFVFT